MEGRKKRDWGTIAAVLCVLLLAVNLWQGKRLENLERRISEAQWNLSAEIKGLESSLYTQAQEEDKLVQNWYYNSSTNMEKRCLDLTVSVVLKAWREDTAAEALWVGDGNSDGQGSAPLTGDGKGTFTGVLEIPLDRGLLEFALVLVTRDGGDVRRENLGGIYDTAELLPVQCTYQGGRTTAEYMKGIFTAYGRSAELYTKADPGGIETESQVFRLRRNDEIVAEQAAEPEDASNRYSCGKLTSEAQPGDRMALTFFCRDENGLGYEFLLQNWVAVAERDVAYVDAEWEDWLKLTWN